MQLVFLSLAFKIFTYYVHMHLGWQYIVHSGQVKDRGQGQLYGVDSLCPPSGGIWDGIQVSMLR